MSYLSCSHIIFTTNNVKPIIENTTISFVNFNLFKPLLSSNKLSIFPMSDAPSHSLKYSNASPKVETIKEGIKVCSLTYSTLRVKWRVGMTNDNRINYSHEPTQTKQEVG
jgi:hypothetical protein